MTEKGNGAGMVLMAGIRVQFLVKLRTDGQQAQRPHRARAK